MLRIPLSLLCALTLLATAAPGAHAKPDDEKAKNDGAPFWRLEGNAGVDPRSQFLGTRDAVPLIFKTNSKEILRLNPDGTVVVGGGFTSGSLFLNGILKASGGIRFPDGLVTTRAQLIGPRGPQGIQGPKGATGPQGPRGLQGPAGPQGAKGATGTPGRVGPKGDKGDPGPIGPKGEKGKATPARKVLRGHRGFPGRKAPRGRRGFPARGVRKALPARRPAWARASPPASTSPA